MAGSVVLERLDKSGDSVVESGGLGLCFFTMAFLTLLEKLPSPAVKQDWVAAIRGLTDR